MQIRLTVLGPHGGPAVPVCDVLVTAPAGAALAAVAGGLADAVAAASAAAGVAGNPVAAGTEAAGSSTGPIVLYAGTERLDAQRCVLGRPPLTDGSVLSLNTPAEPGSHPGVPHQAPPDASAQLHVVAGPDAGGVHLLHRGQISVGRSADADVPLDDPDVSRLHCAITVADDGQVTVTDLGSTNGTSLDGAPVEGHPAHFPSGALLRVGESTLRLVDGQGGAAGSWTPSGVGAAPGTGTAAGAESPSGAGALPDPGGSPGRPTAPGSGVPMPETLPTAPDDEGHLRVTLVMPPGSAVPLFPNGPTSTITGHLAVSSGQGLASRGGPDEEAPADHDPAPPFPVPQPSPVPGEGAVPGAPNHGPADHAASPVPSPAEPGGGASTTHVGGRGLSVPSAAALHGGTGAEPRKARRGRGIGAWARRLAGGLAGGPVVYDAVPVALGAAGQDRGGAEPGEGVPDAAEVLLTALGPGPRLWERRTGRPDALTVRLGTTDRPGWPAVPVTVGLRDIGSLGLAGPRTRLAGLARSVLAQLAASHSPTDLQIVLISTERTRGGAGRPAEWAWLGWLPHLRPAYGQDCRLLLAYDREQAAARVNELGRRLEDGPLGPGWMAADPAAIAAEARRYDGPYTLVIVDGDPGSAALREMLARLAASGPAAGIHLLCLAETPSASPASPLTATFEAACAASPPFSACGMAALLSGDVATALRLMPLGPSGPLNNGVGATVDAVSPAWAERFARALAPLRAVNVPPADDAHRVAAPLPRTARLLDELGLARATPASLLARWAAADTERAEGGRACAVLGRGPHGPLGVDLAAEGPHLLVEGGPGTGKTELLRALAASLATADRPDRVGLVLIDGGGAQSGEGLRVCTDLPHVTGYLAASDPVRMREFSQALSAELKRRAALLGELDFVAWHTREAVAARLVRPRRSSEQASVAARSDRVPAPSGPLNLWDGSPLDQATSLPRLMVLVDDVDELVAPALGSPGRPAAGSVVRALKAVARDGARLGVHLVATTGRPERTAEMAAGQEGPRITLEILPAQSDGPDAGEAAPGRGQLLHVDRSLTPFQTGRVTGRIPRTATMRPTVVPLDWVRMGDPPTRRQLRELGNGPTDLALLASALQRAAAQSTADRPVTAGPGRPAAERPETGRSGTPRT